MASAVVDSESFSAEQDDGQTVSSGLFTNSDNVEEALKDELQNFGSEKSVEERLRSVSLTGSIHELVEDVTQICSKGNDLDISEDQIVDDDQSKEHSPDDEEDLFQDAKEILSPVNRKLSKDMSPLSEDVTLSSSWRFKSKHMFILSEAGKPIYSRYGDENKLASLMAVMQATVSFVQDQGDHIRAVRSSGDSTTIVFLNKKPLVLVAVSHQSESVTQLIVQLTYMYHQVLSVLTQSQLTRIFDQKKGYDLRKMIAGSERLLDSLATSMDVDPSSYMLSAVRVLAMPSNLRESISAVISQSCSKVQNLVFALLIADNKLITLVRMKKYFIHPADLHLIFNLVSSTEAFKLAESWTPICLPKFDSSGFMHAHVSYLSDDSPVCLFMLTVERDIFFELSEARRKIVNSLDKSGNTKKIEDLLKVKEDYEPKDICLPEMKHFLYKSKTTAQFLSSKYPDTKERTERLHNIYLIMKSRLHSFTRPLKLLYYSGSYENVLAWATHSFEVYATFDPMTERNDAFASVNKLLKWAKKEENSLFIVASPTF